MIHIFIFSVQLNSLLKLRQIVYCRCILKFWLGIEQQTSCIEYFSVQIEYFWIESYFSRTFICAKMCIKHIYPNWILHNIFFYKLLFGVFAYKQPICCHTFFWYNIYALCRSLFPFHRYAFDMPSTHERNESVQKHHVIINITLIRIIIMIIVDHHNKWLLLNVSPSVRIVHHLKCVTN